MSNINSWGEFLNDLSEEEIKDLFLTKEQFELVKSKLTVKDFNINNNLKSYLEQLSLNSCQIERLIKFLTIRKIGNQLIQNHKNKLDAQVKMLDIYVANITAHLEALSNIADSFSFDPTADIKQAAISVIIQTQAVIQLNNLTTIREDLQKLIAKDNFCIGSCPDVC